MDINCVIINEVEWSVYKITCVSLLAQTYSNMNESSEIGDGSPLRRR